MRSYLPTTIKIGAIAGVVLLLWVLVVEGNSVGSTFALGNDGDGLELTIDSHATYNGEFQPQLSWDLKDLVPGVDHFFDFENVLPGDTGTTTISIHVDKDDAYVCLNFENLIDKENATGDDDTVNEPESHEDFEAGGELADGMEFFAWFDDGDNVFEVGEKPLFGTSTQS
ncbi:MAG: hypothetical protein KC877_05340, partial [Candidatus Kaiserbacteria bacterium]|nr:hypothetical protein [Candidatus Kaiserbacteria bacterium]